MSVVVATEAAQGPSQNKFVIRGSIECDVLHQQVSLGDCERISLYFSLYLVQTSTFVVGS